MKVKEIVVASLAALLAGCTCTTISDEYSVADPGKSGALRYEKVADLDSRMNYSADVIPVVLRKQEGQEKKDALGGLHGLVWLCTVGLFPAWDTYERTWEVEVKTPVGVKSGTCTRTRREYLGWVPYMLPAAASDSELKSDPSGELARRVVAQFKPEWTTEKVSALNTAEENRIAAQRKRADELLTAKDWNAVIALCANEKDKQFTNEYMRKVKEAETQALEDMKKSLSALLAKHEYDQAEKVLSSEYANWKQVDGHDITAWKSFGDKIQKQKKEVARNNELARIDKRKKSIVQLINAKKYDEAIAECDKEMSLLEGRRYPGRSYYEDGRIWLDCKMTAISNRLAECVGTSKHIRNIFDLARKSAEESSNINFFGFFVGMSVYDANTLAKHYKLKNKEEVYVESRRGIVKGFGFSLKGIRRIVKKGETFQDLVPLVEAQVGDMRIDTDSVFKDAFASSFATVFSGGQISPAVPSVQYVRKTIDGVVVKMFDGNNGGLVIMHKELNLKEPIATEEAKMACETEKDIDKIQNDIDKIQLETDKIDALSEIVENMVSIPGKNFKMGKYEVTQKQWRAVMGNNPSDFKGKDHPVECVSWDDCKVFLERLNALPDVKSSGLAFRLPTEKEWEYACLAGSTGGYCKLADGTEITSSNLGEVAWYADNSGWKTHPVGKKKPNAFGLYDMNGNVGEWCEDLYRAGRSYRMYRGGRWSIQLSGCRASDRDYNSPDLRNSKLGFRLAASQDVNQ